MYSALKDLPFNQLDDDDFYSVISNLRGDSVVINYEKLNNLKFRIFETNVDDDNAIPNDMNDPDLHCNMYRNLASQMSNVSDYYVEQTFKRASKPVRFVRFINDSPQHP